MLPVEIGYNASGALNDSDARLVWELVAEIHKPAEILNRHGLSVADFKLKLRDKMFLAAYKEAKSAWTSELNVQQRVRLKAGLLLEDSLMDIMLVIKDPLMNTVHKLEATKQLANMADIGKQKVAGGDNPAAFKLTINLGTQNPKSVTIDGHSVTNSLTADSV